jgi:hypothetical protein
MLKASSQERYTTTGRPVRPAIPPHTGTTPGGYGPGGERFTRPASATTPATTPPPMPGPPPVQPSTPTTPAAGQGGL